MPAETLAVRSSSRDSASTRSRKKLFFWAGYEYMDQHPAASPINYNVPTTEQRLGDFSETTIDGLPGDSVRVAVAIRRF